MNISEAYTPQDGEQRYLIDIPEDEWIFEKRIGEISIKMLKEKEFINQLISKSVDINELQKDLQSSLFTYELETDCWIYGGQNGTTTNQ